MDIDAAYTEADRETISALMLGAEKEKKNME